MTLRAERFFLQFMTCPTRRSVALTLPGTDLQDVHPAGAIGFQHTVAFVAGRGFQMRRAMPEPEELERCFRPANKAHRQCIVDVTGSAIAKLLIGLVRVTAKTFGVTREAGLHAALLELVTSRAFGLRSVRAHLLRIHVRLVGKTLRATSNAQQAEFVQPSRVISQQRAVVFSNAAAMARSAQRAGLQRFRRSLLEGFGSVTLCAGIVKGQPCRRAPSWLI